MTQEDKDKKLEYFMKKEQSIYPSENKKNSDIKNKINNIIIIIIIFTYIYIIRYVKSPQYYR